LGGEFAKYAAGEPGQQRQGRSHAARDLCAASAGSSDAANLGSLDRAEIHLARNQHPGAESGGRIGRVP